MVVCSLTHFGALRPKRGIILIMNGRFVGITPMPSHSRFPHISRNLCSADRSRVVDGVATETLSAPSRRNPLSTAALHELHVHLFTGAEVAAGRNM